MSIKNYPGLISGVAAKLPGDLERHPVTNPVTDAEIRHAAQYRPGSVAPGAEVVPDQSIPASLPPGAVAEHKFAAGRKWAFDYAWPSKLVALEIEGGIYGRGKKCPMCGRRAVAGHTSIERLLKDMEKYNAASILGWRLIRATPGQLSDGTAAAAVAQALRNT
jgi:hypothetical protein